MWRRDHRRAILVLLVHILAADGAPAKETPGLIVELFGHFLPDATPGFWLGFDRVRIDDLLDHRQVLGQARLAFAAGRFGRFGFGRSDPWGVKRRRRRLLSLQEQVQLGRIELLAAGAKDTFDQQINLLGQERVFAAERLDLLRQLCFARRHLFAQVGRRRGKNVQSNIQ
jgi:hypothetical protein